MYSKIVATKSVNIKVYFRAAILLLIFHKTISQSLIGKRHVGLLILGIAYSHFLVDNVLQQYRDFTCDKGELFKINCNVCLCDPQTLRSVICTNARWLVYCLV